MLNPPCADPLLRGRLAGLAAALLFGVSAPLISTLTGAGSALGIAGLLYGGATLALRDLGAAREAVLFSTAPFVGALFSLLVLREAFTPPLLVAAGLMAVGVVVLLRERHSHWHRHRHDPRGGDPHHEHRHGELEHGHPHVSDAHHRHRH
jgi:drug/metabolite transporter (DMT)-like permease